MTQMQPKEILVHLEKGDRTEEFLELLEGTSYPSVPGNVPGSADRAIQLARDIVDTHMLLTGQGIEIGGAGTLSGRLLGGPTW